MNEQEELKWRDEAATLFNHGDMLSLPQPPDTCMNDCAVSFWV